MIREHRNYDEIYEREENLKVAEGSIHTVKLKTIIETRVQNWRSYKFER
jgi:hypothetical protein